MSTIILTSSLHCVAHDMIKRLDLSASNKILFINTPSETVEGELEWLRDDRRALVEVGFEVTDYTITDKSSEEVRRTVSQTDYIYMSGGDTPYLLEQIKKCNFHSIVRDMVYKEEKIYIGSSAGSIITGPSVPEYLFDDEIPEERKGFEFVNFTIVPHWGSEDFRKKYLEERLEKVYKTPSVPMLLLNDYQYVIVTDGGMKIYTSR